MSKSVLLLKITITVIGVILVFSNDYNSVLHLKFIALVIFYIIFDTIFGYLKRNKSHDRK
ncbi:hypothetical protein [Aquibacillus rhizosphaerae]|uniref:Uncharacterized protein n=1 Tax=Aquibacillus rhizosphaerae TaxID=3051431 RepID=A0ABT7L227_9BACI|nr:hypothetical protein [Aquibacillus sp. LR5S19]MDL4839904.1 hypothetical protein [Aquibacillus sp. LR5S19]